MVKSSEDEEKYLEYIRSMSVTHILMRTDLFDKFLRDNFSKEDITRLMNHVKKYWKKIYEDNRYSVWDIQVR
jgi:hypothetical protein